MPKTTQIISDPWTTYLQSQRLTAWIPVFTAGATASVNIERISNTNVAGSYNVAAAAYAAGVPHFIHVSSQAARAPWIQITLRRRGEAAVQITAHK